MFTKHLVLACHVIVVLLLSIAGNLVTQISFGEPRMTLNNNIERDIISRNVMNSAIENITVNKSQEFPIILESNPGTGYQWIPNFNTGIINLVSHRFEPSTTRLIGAAGTDIFKFKAIGYGTESLKMLFKRSWEKEIAKEKVFVINVK